MTGIKNDEEHYLDLQNNFISIALQDKDHPSLPPISVAIYCCVAQRLGLRAYPCGFPLHALAIIKPVDGLDMDGRAIHSPEEAKPMYLDPFRSDEEVPVSDLQNQLADMGVSMSEYGALLDSSSTVDIIRRTARNIITAVQKPPHIHASNSSRVDSATAFYGALWALLLLPKGSLVVDDMRRAQFLPYVMEHLKNQYFMDVGLAELYVLPMFKSFVPTQDTTRLIRASESEPKTAKRRGHPNRTEVKYCVGQVFSHIRYRYQAVIIGWDMECEASEQWMSHMSVDDLASGRHQSFYHVLYVFHTPPDHAC